jgi:hypothetical protein
MTNIAIRMPAIVGVTAISATVAHASQYALRRALEQLAFFDVQNNAEDSNRMHSWSRFYE